MLFSDEINNAIKYGYKFNILRGYLFEKPNIFSDYMPQSGGLRPYEIKQSHSKSDPMYLISKLLLNSCRFAAGGEAAEWTIDSMNI